MESLYDYSDYKAYLKAYLASQPKRGHGLKSKWAAGLGCQSAYLSRVLNQDAQLSMEQADELSTLLEHSHEESHFFLLLVQKERAGTHSLKNRMESQLDEITKKRELLRNRVDIKERLSEQDQVKYYSSWHYAILHIAPTIEKFQTKKALSEHFNIPMPRVNEGLEFLESIGLVESHGDRFSVGKNRMFLGSDSDLISKHHSNWRVRAIDSLDRGENDDVHLSTIFTMSKDDLKEVKDLLLKSIDRARKIVKDTGVEEEIVCFNLDLFSISNDT